MMNGTMRGRAHCNLKKEEREKEKRKKDCSPHGGQLTPSIIILFNLLFIHFTNLILFSGMHSI